MPNEPNNPEADVAKPVKDNPTKTKSRRKAKGKAPRLREASSIVFPYRDLEVGISVASAMMNAGGVALTTEQLSGVMKLQAGSGNFVVKVATARIFGLISYTGGKYELTQMGFEIVDSDEVRQRSARASAFQNVPLYKRVYEEFRGKQLPPRPHGLEQALVKFGVAPKQKQTARLVFDKSANQAGFFLAGPDRLVQPIIGGAPLADRNRANAQEEVDRGNNDKIRTIERNDLEVADLHPFIEGLLDTLPEPGTTWTIDGRAKWLQAAAHCFDLMYTGSGEVTITVKSEPPKTE